MTNYYFSEEHQLFRESLRAFLKKEVLPHIDDWEEQRRTPKEIFKKLGSMGFLGVDVAEEYGGMGQNFMYHAILCEEASRCQSGGFAAAILAHVSLAMVYINRFGSDDLKKRYLPKSCKGEWVGCLAVTEPGAGSDVSNIKTRAVRDGDHYIINGSKTFITNGVYSDYIVAAVKTEGKSESLIVIDRNTEGVSATKLKKLGWHASDTGEIHFDGVRVPVENLLGIENMGFYYIMQNFALERLVLALGAIAACEDAIDYTLRYMNEREAFGRKINRFQVLRHRIAQLCSEIERMKIYNHNVTKTFSAGENVVKQCAMAKLLSTQLSDKVMTECLQCFGGYGFMEEYKIARMFRDSRLGTIGGGTSEIMCELLAKMVVDEVEYERVD